MVAAVAVGQVGIRNHKTYLSTYCEIIRGGKNLGMLLAGRGGGGNSRKRTPPCPGVSIRDRGNIPTKD